MTVKVLTEADVRAQRDEALALLGITLQQYREDLADYEGETHDLAEWYLRPTAAKVHAAVEALETCDFFLGDS